MKSIYGVTLSLLAVSGLAIAADDNADLDDIRDWPMVKMETCLDAALDTIPGHARKLELKMEGDDTVDVRGRSVFPRLQEKKAHLAPACASLSLGPSNTPEARNLGLVVWPHARGRLI